MGRPSKGTRMRVNVRLDLRTYVRLSRLCMTRDETLNDIIIEAVNDYLDVQETR